MNCSLWSCMPKASQPPPVYYRKHYPLHLMVLKTQDVGEHCCKCLAIAFVSIIDRNDKGIRTALPPCMASRLIFPVKRAASHIRRPLGNSPDSALATVERSERYHHDLKMTLEVLLLSELKPHTILVTAFGMPSCHNANLNAGGHPVGHTQLLSLKLEFSDKAQKSSLLRRKLLPKSGEPSGRLRHEHAEYCTQ